MPKKPSVNKKRKNKPIVRPAKLPLVDLELTARRIKRNLTQKRKLLHEMKMIEADYRTGIKKIASIRRSDPSFDQQFAILFKKRQTAHWMKLLCIQLDLWTLEIAAETEAMRGTPLPKKAVVKKNKEQLEFQKAEIEKKLSTPGAVDKEIWRNIFPIIYRSRRPPTSI